MEAGAKKKTIQTCSFCKQPGHRITTCPLSPEKGYNINKIATEMLKLPDDIWEKVVSRREELKEAKKAVQTLATDLANVTLDGAQEEDKY